MLFIFVLFACAFFVLFGCAFITLTSVLARKTRQFSQRSAYVLKVSISLKSLVMVLKGLFILRQPARAPELA